MVSHRHSAVAATRRVDAPRPLVELKQKHATVRKHEPDIDEKLLNGSRWSPIGPWQRLKRVPAAAMRLGDGGTLVGEIADQVLHCAQPNALFSFSIDVPFECTL